MMMKYFLNGVWSNDDTVSILPPGATAMTDAEWESRLGATYIPTMAETASTKITQLAEAFQIAIQQPVNYMGTAFQADSASRDALIQALAPGALPANFAWRDVANNMMSMTYTQLQGLAGVMLAQSWAAFQRMQERKATVRAATTVEAIVRAVW
jgi:hypothetical protein